MKLLILVIVNYLFAWANIYALGVEYPCVYARYIALIVLCVGYGFTFAITVSEWSKEKYEK